MSQLGCDNVRGAGRVFPSWGSPAQWLSAFPSPAIACKFRKEVAVLREEVKVRLGGK